MERRTHRRTVERSTIGLWLAGAVLSGTACRDDHIAGPSDRERGAAAPSLATSAATPSFAQVSAGGAHSCGLVAGGQLYCWGWNTTGQLGDGTYQNRAVPTLVGGGLLFRQVSAGSMHTCAVTTDNRAYCWGYNAWGVIGDGTTIEAHSTPVPVAGNRRFRQISAGDFHTCALTPTTTNTIYCWGTGHLGNGSDSPEFRTPQLVSGDHAYRQVSAGNAFTCAVTTTYQALCWGVNNWGQLGNGGSTAFVALTPVAVSGALQVLQVSAGEGHACAVTATAKAYCWGHGRWGQLGDGQTSSRFRPRAVVGGLSFSHISTGAHYTCGQTPKHRAYCWGSSYNGQLGNGTYSLQRTPTTVKGGLAFRQLEAGAYHVCGVDGASRAWCWGANFSGELGNGSVGPSSPTPSLVE